MKALLDTHTFLWWVTNNLQLSSTVKSILSERNNRIFFSAASSWEIAIKAQLSKLELPSNPEVYIAEQLEINSFQVLPIELKYTLQTYYLPNHHKDPFDRILVAQSQVENLPLLTLDPKIAQYQVSIIW
ncbi:type II toxin-antitoxin system VapC family toxin [Calothrix sp. PCC 6303]|uniref:type II toxin-antitoxin system VapC family toxin n=1 Tax=Calothrix sp. PCC 6303 TaxID=1170562 RepID=UPI0002A01A56|nr:type II toxin-antitoxin system VapC family toxin [Calothrix sp. PCC 6303]AFY99875.1 PilT protein domain protein [Calothrix sp. PCC 6303]